MSGSTVTLKRNPAFKPDGPKAYARVAHKYGIKATEHTTFFMRKNVLYRKHATGDTQVNAEDIKGELEYVIPVQIGSALETVHMDLDTGSSDFWVITPETPLDSEHKKSHRHFDYKSSRSARTLVGHSWKIQYGDGSEAWGRVLTDNIKIGNILIRNQAIEIADQISPQFAGGASDGLLGCAFDKLNTVTPKQQLTPMSNMVRQGLLTDNIFTCRLGYGKSESFYSFGNIVENVLPEGEELVYIPINPRNGFWETTCNSITFHGADGDATIPFPERSPGILDTGTTLIVMDDATLENFYGKIQGAKLDYELGGYVIPSDCEVPDVTFKIGDKLDIDIPGKTFKFADIGNGYHFGGCQSSGGIGMNILGDLLLKCIYAVWDPKEPRFAAGRLYPRKKT